MRSNDIDIACHKTVAVTIANGQTLSTAANLVGGRLTGILWPAAMTNTAMDVHCSIDGATWYPVSSLKNIVVTASEITAISPTNSPLAFHVKLKGSAEGAARTVTLIYQPTV